MRNSSKLLELSSLFRTSSGWWSRPPEPEPLSLRYDVRSSIPPEMRRTTPRYNHTGQTSSTGSKDNRTLLTRNLGDVGDTEPTASSGYPPKALYSYAIVGASNERK